MQPPEIMDRLIVDANTVVEAMMSVIRDNQGKEGDYELPDSSTLVIENDPGTSNPDCEAPYFNLLCGEEFSRAVEKMYGQGSSAIIAAEGKRICCYRQQHQPNG